MALFGKSRTAAAHTTIICSFQTFSHQRYLMVSHGSLSESKCPQVSRTLLTILADFNNVVVWIDSTCPLISQSSSPFTNTLGIFPKAPMTIGITLNFGFYSFFLVLLQSLGTSFFLLSFIFTLWFARTAKITSRLVLFFLFFFFFLTITRSGHLAKNGWSVCISES